MTQVNVNQSPPPSDPEVFSVGLIMAFLAIAAVVILAIFFFTTTGSPDVNVVLPSPSPVIR